MLLLLRRSATWSRPNPTSNGCGRESRWHRAARLREQHWLTIVTMAIQPPLPDGAPAGPVVGATTVATGGRIHGIDLARGIAMFFMTIVHFVAWWEGEGSLFTAAELSRGRAMPLFMLLGGVGVTIMARRSSTPTRNLLIRAVMLLALGFLLTEFVDRLAIVLQAYALFFVLAVVLWRLPSSVLLALVPSLVAVGAATYQLVGTPREITPFQTFFDSTQGVESLVFDGFYPLFPVGAFFIFGMWLARLDLRSEQVAAKLLAAGTVIGVGVWVSTWRIVYVQNIQVDFGGNRGDGQFHWARLLDYQGHSAMPAWTISALGTSAAVLGLSLILAPLLPRLVRPITILGTMSLTYYVYQALFTNVVPDTVETGVGSEWLFVLGVYGSFIPLASLWKRWFRSGPLERVLRIGSGSSRSAASTSAAST